MTDNFGTRIDKIRDSLNKQRFIDELEFLKTNDNPEKQRIQMLDKIANGPVHKELTNKSTDIKNYFNDIDKHIYTKPWSKLPVFHKVEKMKEYINETVEKNYEHKEKLIKELTDLLMGKKFTAKKYIDYDQEKCKIVSFSALKFETDGIYTIKTT